MESAMRPLAPPPLQEEERFQLSSHTWVETATGEICLWCREILDAERDPKWERERN